MRTVNYGVRETPTGYCLTDITIKERGFGGVRKYSHDLRDLKYKRKEFAIKKAHAFYQTLYNNHNVHLVFFGCISNDEYTGELA